MNKESKLFKSDSGDLYKLPNFDRPLREKYSYTFRDFTDDPHRLKLRATIRNGEFAWPGGYQMYLLDDEGSSICFDCAKKEYWQLAHGYWKFIACDINYEDTEMCCEHCNKKIPSAYGEDTE